MRIRRRKGHRSHGLIRTYVWLMLVCTALAVVPAVALTTSQEVYEAHAQAVVNPTVTPSPVATYMIAKTIRSLHRRKSPQTCHTTNPRASTGTAVTIPVAILSAVSFRTGSTSSRAPATSVLTCGNLPCRAGSKPAGCG